MGRPLAGSASGSPSRLEPANDPHADGRGPGSAFRLPLLLLLATALRLYRLDAHGLWIDEMVSANLACGSILPEPVGSGADFAPSDFWKENTLARVTEAVAQDGGNGIVYHLLLHCWVFLGGTADGALRLPSVAAGVLVVATTFVLARRLATPTVAWWATLLAAAHPLLIRLSQEARPYSLATALGSFATLLLVRGIEDEVRAWVFVAYALTAATLVLTHYLAAVVLIAHAAFVVFGPVAARRRDRAVLALVGAGLLASLWLPFGGARGLTFVRARNLDYRARAERGESKETFARPTEVRSLAAGAAQMAAAVSGNTLQKWGIRLSQVSMVLVIPGSLIVAAWRHRATIERVPGAVCLLTVLSLAALAAAAALAVISGHVISFQPLYGTFVAPFAMILLAVGVAAGGPVTRVALAGQLAVVIASVLSVYADAPAYRPRNAYPTMAAAALAAREGTVVHHGWPEARMVNLYLPAGPTPRQRVRVPAAAR